MRAEAEAKGDARLVGAYSSESDHASTMLDNLKDRVKNVEDKV